MQAIGMTLEVGGWVGDTSRLLKILKQWVGKEKRSQVGGGVCGLGGMCPLPHLILWP